jgi:HEAT repeat protein
MLAAAVLTAQVVMAVDAPMPAFTPGLVSASHVHDARSDRVERLVRVMCTRDDKGLHLDAAERLAEMGAESTTALERCLDSQDWFTRQAAAYALRLSEGYVPKERMLAVTVEGLGDDDLPLLEQKRDVGGFLIYNARGGLEYLVRHAASAAPLVCAGLASSDVQRRFLCAVIIAASRTSEDSLRAIEILTTHLNSNENAGDAGIAEAALALMSPAALMPLRQAVEGLDAQGREAVARVIHALESAESTPVHETPEDRSHRLEYAIHVLATKEMQWHQMK